MVQNTHTMEVIDGYVSMKKRGIVSSQVEFCKLIGMNRTSFNLALKGERDIPYKYYIKFREVYKKFQKETKGVPVVNTDFTASDITQFDDETPQVIGYVDLEGFRRCKWIVRVKGPSMTPKLIPGDFIGLEPETDIKIIEYGQPYAITSKSGKKLVKIIRKGKDDNHLILRSTNPDFDDINIHKKDIRDLYKVHGPIRDEWQ